MDSANKRPVAGAMVSLECRISRFHGSEKLKELSTTSDKNGHFTFSRSDLRSCSFAYVKPSKDGYQATETFDIRYADTSYGEVPKTIWLTPLKGVHQQKLELMKAMVSGRYASTPYEYASVYQSFAAAKKISESREDRVFVHETYCSRLLKLFESLSEDEKDSLHKSKMMGVIGEPATPSRDAHQKEVVAFCSANF